MENHKSKKDSLSSIIKAMGLVFGDIGTSPIYTLTVIFFLTPPTPDNIEGILSLIFWTLIILVTLEYTFLAMSLSSRGEGGIIVLKELLSSSLKSGRKVAFITFLGYIGISLLMGDGVITPAISILSAVEGLELIPGIGHLNVNVVIIITIAITIALFSIQKKGTDKVAASFGPIMVIWFLTLFVSGIFSIANRPEVLISISPHKAIEFFEYNGFAGFFVLSEVILCATGGEALYADMGHLGRKPIRNAWYFVFVALVVNYFGQGAFAFEQGGKTNLLFGMIKSQVEFLYIPFLILTLLATIIASQAMISAMFSLVYQGIRIHIMPLLKVKYTSQKLKSQIYINAVNWGLLAAVIVMILIFQKSENLAAAYGLAVTATMTISATFISWIFYNRREYTKMILTIMVFLVDVIFLLAVFDKIPHGGYASIIVAAIPFLIIIIWMKGSNAMKKSFRPLSIVTFLVGYKQIYDLKNNIKGTAIFFTKDLYIVPPYMVHCMLRTGIIYENNISVSIKTMEEPFGIKKVFVPNIEDGISGLEIQAGYMEVLDLPRLFHEQEINAKAIFYGVEDIYAKKLTFKIYSFLKKITPNFVQFHKLPYNKLHGVVTRLDI